MRAIITLMAVAAVDIRPVILPNADAHWSHCLLAEDEEFKTCWNVLYLKQQLHYALFVNSDD